MKNLDNIIDEEFNLAMKSFKPKYGLQFSFQINQLLGKLKKKKYNQEQRNIIKRNIVYLIRRQNEIFIS